MPLLDRLRRRRQDAAVFLQRLWKTCALIFPPLSRSYARHLALAFAMSLVLGGLGVYLIKLISGS